MSPRSNSLSIVFSDIKSVEELSLLTAVGSLEDLISSFPSQFSVMLRANLTALEGGSEPDSASNEDTLKMSVSNNSMSSSLSRSRPSENSLYASVERDKPAFTLPFSNVHRGMSEDVAWLCLQDLSTALDFMHSKGTAVATGLLTLKTNLD